MGDLRLEFPPVMGRARFQNLAPYGRFVQADMAHQLASAGQPKLTKKTPERENPHRR